MYRLARIRCTGIGPADARFDQPSPELAPFEVSCLDASDEPSDTLLWLENGGGKTVFLALLFHVLRPDRAPLIGGDGDGVPGKQRRRGAIDEYLLSGDVGHVLCEWMADDSDVRLITGLVAEKRGSGVVRSWYMLVVRDQAFSIDQMVFSNEGRRLRPGPFLESLQEIARASATGRRRHIDYFGATTQKQWLALLADHDLDPTLFEYQALMNRAEGRAASLFRFRDSDEFIEFFLKLTMNPDSVDKLSETLSRVAEKVADLPRKELDLGYCTGAAQRLDELASAYRDHNAAAGDAADAHADAERLDDALAAGIEDLDGRCSDAEGDVGIAEELQREADRNRRDADTRAAALAIAAADAKIAVLKTEEHEAAQIARSADLVARAWAIVPELGRRDRLRGEQNELKVELDDQSAPLRDRRNTLLFALRDRLSADLASERETYELATHRAEELEGEEEDARKRQMAALDSRTQAASKAELLEARAAEGTEALDDARARGMLGAAETPSEALRRAKYSAAEAESALEGARELRRNLVLRVREAGDAANEAKEAAREATGAAQRARDIVSVAVDERSALAETALAVELGGEGVDLELVGAELVSRASTKAQEHRAAAVRTAAESDDDERAAASLEAHRLLPARREVETLCAALAGGGIRSAVPGWRYLAEAVHSALHDEVIAAHPALLDGIVVADSDFTAAQDLLAGAGPAAAIVLSAGSLLASAEAPGSRVGESEETPAPERAWVVPPDPALFDPAGADAALESRRAKLAGSAQRIAAEDAAEQSARAFVEALDAHLEHWPPGALETARAVAEAAGSAATFALDRAAQAQSEHAKLVVEAENAESGVNAAQDAKTKSGQLATVLENLEWQIRQAAQAGREAEQLRARETEAQLETDAADLERIRAQDAAAEQRQLAQRAEQATAGLTQSLADLPDPGEASVAGVDGVMAAESLTELRSRFAEADRLLTSAISESQVAQRLAHVEDELSEIGQRIGALESDLREAATALVATPQASNESARSAAERDARRVRDHRSSVHSDVKSQLLLAGRERKALSEPDRVVELGTLPESAEELAALAGAAARAADVARQERNGAEEALRRARADLQQLSQDLDALESRRRTLSALLNQRDLRPADPFTGDAAAAVDAAVARLGETSKRLSGAQDAQREAGRSLTSFAREQRWAELNGELAARLFGDDPDVLAAEAEALCTQVRLKMDRLRDDIKHLDVYRGLLLESLGEAVSTANASLRRASRQSLMPDGLGAWSNHPFLKLSVSLPADATELRARLRRFTNDLVERVSGGSLPQGADLVCKALLACSEREVNVEVLKPNKAQRLVYVPISELAPLSGGMRATAAIALFCTLAKVRATNQGAHSGVGTLILDNPLGEASSTYLVALQRLMAEKNGIQLLYTSAVNDYDAIRLFPVVNRLNNETGRRSQLAYVVADPTFLKQLAGGDGDSSLVVGSRLLRRKPIQLTFDVLAATAAQLPGDEL